MQIFDQQTLQQLLDWPSLIACLETIFQDESCTVPVRHHHTIPHATEQDATMLLMPAWIPGKYSGVKIVTVFPSNARKNIATIHGNYMLINGTNGATLAIMDGGELTARRTAAASALAAKYLSRKESSKLFLVGSGRVARYLGAAHMAVRPSIEKIKIWSRSLENAEKAVHYYRENGLNASLCSSLEQGSRWADIISCATLSSTPLIRGDWVQPGTHIDLVGAFKPEMRESDTNLICRADIFVDTRKGALSEAGDLLIPIRENKFSPDDIIAELSELGNREKNSFARQDDRQITLFKSVGAAQEDLAAAVMCYEKWWEKAS